MLFSDGRAIRTSMYSPGDCEPGAQDRLASRILRRCGLRRRNPTAPSALQSGPEGVRRIAEYSVVTSL
jgi:hypothetical protein